MPISFTYASAEKPSSVSWWAIRFDKVEETDLDFWIENRSSQEDFRYEIWKDDEKVRDEKSVVAKDEERKIDISDDFKDAEKITVKVFLGEEERDIYKLSSFQVIK